MAAARKSVQLARAIKRATKLHAVIAKHVRDVLDLRTEVCDEHCRGWFCGDRGIERCDDCARMNGYADTLHDELFTYLPEARGACAMADAFDDDTRTVSRDERQLIEWLKSNISPGVGEWYAHDAVRMAAHLMQVTPEWLARRCGDEPG